MTSSRHLDQILASTRLDRHGERIPLEILESIARSAAGRVFPLHQQHAMALPTVGTISSLRVVRALGEPGEWNLVGVVDIAQGELDPDFSGFSISFMDPVRRREDHHASISLPYPAYHEDELLGPLIDDESLQVQRWIRKSANPDLVALYVAAAIFAFTPVWDDIYKTTVGPYLRAFLQRHWNTLSKRGLGLHVVQRVLHRGDVIEILFLCSPGKEEACCSEEMMHRGLQVVAKLLLDLPESEPLIGRIVLSYEVSTRAYEVLRVEHRPSD